MVNLKVSVGDMHDCIKISVRLEMINHKKGVHIFPPFFCWHRSQLLRSEPSQNELKQAQLANQIKILIKRVSIPCRPRFMASYIKLGSGRLQDNVLSKFLNLLFSILPTTNPFSMTSLAD